MVLPNEVMRSRTVSIPRHICERGNGSRERKHRMQEQQHLAAAERGVVDPGGADSALVEAVGGSSSEAIRLRRARTRAGGIGVEREERRAFSIPWFLQRCFGFVNPAHFRKVLCRI